MFRGLRTSYTFRTVAATTAAALLWLAFPSHVFAKPPAKPKPVSLLKPGLTQTPDAALRKKIDAKEAAARNKPRPDVRLLSAKEMTSLYGRGIYPHRNEYFNGSVPWQRSFRDVNLTTGNLFKSFTDMQVAPARGAGLALQRTYNSNDGRIGPFGIGWTHAYDIRIEESGQLEPVTEKEIVPRTDFFGGKHKYVRDADGLYSPPAYLFDEMDSKYGEFLVNGPAEVLEDQQIGMDGTIKHFVSGGTDADGSPSSVRVCDFIEDRHGNRTSLDYETITWPDGSTQKLLNKVTDPSGRFLTFTWNNLGSAQEPAWRIVRVDGPIYGVSYDYDNAEKNLSAVHLDPEGLNRTTTFGYTSFQGSNGTAWGLLASITDPLGQNTPDPLDHMVSYRYSSSTTPFDTAYVDRITESTGDGPMNWYTGIRFVSTPHGSGIVGQVATVENNFTVDAGLINIYVQADPGTLAVRGINVGTDSYVDGVTNQYGFDYDTSYNVLRYSDGPQVAQFATVFEYGPHGNVLTLQRAGSNNAVTTYDYFNASKYFQKRSVQSPEGNISTFDYFDKFDPNPGNRGSVKWVRDAGYDVVDSPSFGRQFDYTYNQHGQKETETNLNGVLTRYTYGDAWGNLTQVVQDEGTGKLNRTTAMDYDVAGRVKHSIDPMSQISAFTYNNLGQPETASFPAVPNSGTLAETISYGYEANGRTEWVRDNRGTTSIQYEPNCDRVRSITDPLTGTVSYTYKLTGERRTMMLPGGGTWTYNYDWIDDPHAASVIELPSADLNSVRKVLSSIRDEQNREVVYRSWGTGKIDRTVANKTYDPISTELISYQETKYRYEGVARLPYTFQGIFYNVRSLGHLLQIKTTFHARDASGNWQARTLVQNDYVYDKNGNRKTNTLTTLDGSGQLTSRTENYDYDELSRLKDVNYGDGQTQSYGFDAMGNRTGKSDSMTGSETYAFDNANRLTNRNGQSYTNDANGNTVEGGGRTNIWDSQNRLVQCVKDGITSAYVYGADGLRRRATVTNAAGQVTQTDYVLDGQNVVQEIVRRAASTDELGTAPAETITYLQGPSGPLYRKSSNAAHAVWYVYDGLGSVVGETNVNGVFTASRKFDVYGFVRGSSGTSMSRHKFVGSLGHQSDDETGLIYMRARYYDPAVGRFVSEDPAGDGTNWFAYCGGDPVNFADPTGKSGVPVIDLGGGWGIRIDGGKGEPTADMHIWHRGQEIGSIWNSGTWKHVGELSNSQAKDLIARLQNHSSKRVRGWARVLGRAGYGAISSLDAYFQEDPLGFIATMFDAGGDHETAAGIDRLNAM